MTDHFGDPFREQRALARGDAVVMRNECGVIRLSGRDRLTWLDSLVSQEVAGLAAGESAEALLLDPNGRIERVMRILDDGTNSWILVDADSAGLASWLDRMVFRRDVDVADVSDAFTVVGFFDSGRATTALAPLTAAPNGVPLTWVDPWSSVASGGWQYSSPAGHPALDWTYREALREATAPTGTALRHERADGLGLGLHLVTGAGRVDVDYGVAPGRGALDGRIHLRLVSNF